MISAVYHPPGIPNLPFFPGHMEHGCSLLVSGPTCSSRLSHDTGQNGIRMLFCHPRKATGQAKVPPTPPFVRFFLAGAKEGLLATLPNSWIPLSALSWPVGQCPQLPCLSVPSLPQAGLHLSSDSSVSEQQSGWSFLSWWGREVTCRNIS